MPQIHTINGSATRSAATAAPPRPAVQPSPQPLAYELLQGNLVRFSSDASSKAAPTAVLIHGILGQRRNLQSFARMLVEGFPTWQVLLVDLRCHGESAAAHRGIPLPAGPHTVESAAADVLALLRSLKAFPHMLVGHSFGGKVALSMVRQFGTAALPRPVQVWVLDTLPGEVRAGSGPGRMDHPADIISSLQRLGPIVPSRAAVQDHLTNAGFSLPIARWLTTNLRPADGAAHVHAATALRWGFDLDGVAEMYESYERADLWPMLHAPPQGLCVDFVRAEHSTFRWSGDTEDRITSLGHRVHLLRDAGHWVHSDNPVGLFDIMAPTFHTGVDLHMQHMEPGKRRR